MKETQVAEIPDAVTPKKGCSRCGGYVGYLRRLPENAPIPRECMTCPKLADCMIEVF